MCPRLQEVATAAMALSPNHRAELAELLLDSLDPAAAHIDPAYEREVKLRIKEIEENRAELLPHDEVMSEIRKRLRAPQ
jgi:putative addiction module component (TIGR02574 family)